MLTSKDVQTVEDAKRLVEERNLSHIKVGIFDMDGVMLGKHMSRKKFFFALEHGFSFCDVILGWDSIFKILLKILLIFYIQGFNWETAYMHSG